MRQTGQPQFWALISFKHAMHPAICPHGTQAPSIPPSKHTTQHDDDDDDDEELLLPLPSSLLETFSVFGENESITKEEPTHLSPFMLLEHICCLLVWGTFTADNLPCVA